MVAVTVRPFATALLFSLPQAALPQSPPASATAQQDQLLKPEQLNRRDKFVAAYNAKYQIETEGDEKAVLIIGEHDWPFPVPLIKKAKGWQFDSSAGLEESLAPGHWSPD